MGIVRSYNGKNICFYYYGQDHLVVNLFKYIKNCLERNVFVYLYIDDDVKKMLEKNLTENELKMIRTVLLDDKLLKVRGGTLKYYEEIVKGLKKDALDVGYFGSTIIIDASNMIKSIRESMFNEFLSCLTDICNDIKIDILTCYDFIDYIQRNKYITEDIMKQSYKHHNFRMFSNEIIPVENFILHDKDDNLEKTSYYRNN